MCVCALCKVYLIQCAVERLREALAKRGDSRLAQAPGGGGRSLAGLQAVRQARIGRWLGGGAELLVSSAAAGWLEIAGAGERCDLGGCSVMSVASWWVCGIYMPVSASNL